jgi:hypothetical protein
LIPEPHASLQRKLLESEGVQIVEMRVDYARHGWNPKRAVRSGIKVRKKSPTKKKKPR